MSSAVCAGGRLGRIGRVAALGLCGLALVTTAAPPVYREHDIKAAFLFRFLQLVEWPESAFHADAAPLVIAVVLPDPFGPVLDLTVADEYVDGRPIVIKRAPTAAAALPCHLLFVPQPAANQAPAALPTPPPRGVLLVGETPDFIDRGGMIRFYPEENRIRFEINPDHVEQAGLRIRSRLLRLARITSAAVSPPGPGAAP